MKKVSIIIPTFNKLIRLRLALKALEPEVDENVEVIVVFDGCDKVVIDQFHKLKLSYKPIEIINERNVGRARARNMGIKAATGDVVFFLDDDRLVNPGYVKAHLELHEKGYGVVLGQRNQLFMKESDIVHYYEDTTNLFDYCEQNGEIEIYAFGHGANSPIRWMNFFTGNVSVDRKALLDVGCFDSFFTKWGHEDLDLGIRLYLKGVRYGYTTKGNNYHLMHESNFDSKREQSAMNLRYMIGKYNRYFGICMMLRLLYMKQSVFGVKISKDQKAKFQMLSQE
ncbi:glycosyltransferase family 2 protein [Butyrivibrio fibrisolvens]|uniref:glycosyltransferase family 2 protein n=1 Tax=Butyrivibrio fibrisolvens TaxID=831 RepID=UPI000410CE25|nr:glycosyltransferase [Butyrivibrio fibrisolvens]